MTEGYVLHSFFSSFLFGRTQKMFFLVVVVTQEEGGVARKRATGTRPCIGAQGVSELVLGGGTKCHKK